MKRWGLILLGGFFLLAGCMVVVRDVPRDNEVVTPGGPVYAPGDKRVYGYLANQAQHDAMVSDDSNAEIQSQAANSEQEGEDQPEAEPSADDVWVDAVAIANEVVIPGFWRPHVKAGFVWRNGFWDKRGDWIPGYWEPVKMAYRDKVWVPGFWINGIWVAGHWRVKMRAGYIWIPGHWNRQGVWIQGYWQPLKARAGYVWVGGYWNAQGHWVAGRWRPKARKGYIWIGGHFDRLGLWISGGWQRAKKGYEWVPGYWGRQNRWIPGQWREQERQGYYWQQGGWSKNGHWLPGHWNKGKRAYKALPPRQGNKSAKPAPQRGRQHEQTSRAQKLLRQTQEKKRPSRAQQLLENNNRRQEPQSPAKHKTRAQKVLEQKQQGNTHSRASQMLENKLEQSQTTVRQLKSRDQQAPKRKLEKEDDNDSEQETAPAKHQLRKGRPDTSPSDQEDQDTKQAKPRSRAKQLLEDN